MDKLVRNLVFFLILLVLEFLLLVKSIDSFYQKELIDDIFTCFCITIVGYFISQFIYAGIIAGKKHLEFINGHLQFVFIVYVVFVGLILWSGRAKPYIYHRYQIAGFALCALMLLGMYAVAFFFAKDKAVAANPDSKSTDMHDGIKLKLGLVETNNSKHKTSEPNAGLILDDFSEGNRASIERAEKYEKRLGLNIKIKKGELSAQNGKSQGPKRLAVIKRKIPSLLKFFDRYIKKAKGAIKNEESFATRVGMTSEFLRDIGYYTLNLLYNEVKIKKGTEDKVKNEEVVLYFLENYSSSAKLFNERSELDTWLNGRREKFCRSAYGELEENEKLVVEAELDQLQSRSILFAIDEFVPLFDIDFGNEIRKE